MNLRFTNWYTQALGATLGIIACIYAYLNGFIITYGNIDTYFDTLSFSSIVSSYLLLPLCIVTLLLAVIKSFTYNKKLFNISIENFNIGIIIATVIIGFMGAKIYFTIPSLFILFNLATYKYGKTCLQEDNNTDEEITDKINEVDEEFKEESTLIFNSKQSIESKNLRTLNTKIEMAKELLSKNAQKEFILEITGLTLEELEDIEEYSSKI